MLENGQVIVAIDPTDAWSGLRSSADGKSEGYPILVIGGDHGDLKLEPELGAGIRLAEAIVAERFSCVICTDGLDDTLAIRYVREVLQTLFRKNREPIHVFVDECDIFAPQQPKEAGGLSLHPRAVPCRASRSQEGDRHDAHHAAARRAQRERAQPGRDAVRARHAAQPRHRRGREVDAPTQEEAWEQHRVRAPGGDDRLARLSPDKATPGCGRRGSRSTSASARAQKRTFDSGATPKPGQKTRAAKRLAPVDIQRLGAAIADAAKRQKENDPTELKRQVAALRKELASVGKGQDRAEANDKASHAESYGLRTRVAELERALTAAGKIKEKIVIKKVEVVKAADLRRLEALVKKIDKLILRITGTRADLELHLTGLRAEAGKLKEIATRVTEFHAKKKGDAGKLIDDVMGLASDAPGVAQPPAPARVSDRQPRKIDAKISAKKPPALPKSPPPVLNGEHATLKPVHLRFLSAIAWWESIGVSAPDLGGVAFVAKTSTKSSAFDNNRSRLRSGGYIDYPSPGYVKLTDVGRSLAPPPDLEPTNEALQGAILEKVPPALGRLLRVLIDAYPEEVSLEEFAKGAGTSTSSSAFDNNRSWLRARGLADYPRTGFVRATQLLFPEAS